MKIALLFESLKIWGGVEKIQGEQSLMLEKLGHQVSHLLLEDSFPRNRYTWKIEILWEKFIFGFWFQKILLLLKLALRVKKYCKENKIECIVGQGDFFYMVTWCARLFGMKTISMAIVHSTIRIWPKMIETVLLFFLRGHRKIILISQEEYEYFRDVYHFPLEKIDYIPNVFDISYALSQSRENISLNYSSFSQTDTFKILHIWRLTAQKNQKNLLDAFLLLYERYKRVELWIIGEGDQKNALEAYIESFSGKSHIHFLGKQKNVYPFLLQADAFVLSSDFEWFGLVLLEAMSMGLPIVSTRCPTGPKELLWGKKQSGYEEAKYGILVDIKDPEQLSEAFYELIKNPLLQKSFLEAGKERLQDFSPEKISQKWEQLLDKISLS